MFFFKSLYKCRGFCKDVVLGDFRGRLGMAVLEVTLAAVRAPLQSVQNWSGSIHKWSGRRQNWSGIGAGNSKIALIGSQFRVEGVGAP